MPREKKDGRYINYRIRHDLYEMFEQYAEEKGQSKTVAIERILKAHHQVTHAEKWRTLSVGSLISFPRL